MSSVRHEEMIDALDRISLYNDFDPQSWSEHDADRLLQIAQRIQGLVVDYYRKKEELEKGPLDEKCDSTSSLPPTSKGT